LRGRFAASKVRNAISDFLGPFDLTLTTTRLLFLFPVARQLVYLIMAAQGTAVCP